MNRNCWSILLAVLLFAPVLAFGDNSNGSIAIPTGTIIPVQLSTSLSSAKSEAGETIKATVKQDVPLANGAKIHKGAKLIGRVEQVTPPGPYSGGQITLRWESLKEGKSVTPISTDLRALASGFDVEQAQTPAVMSDEGTPPAQYTTTQIGGDTVYRGGGPVVNRYGEAVGKPAANGILAMPAANSAAGCRGEIGSAQGRQAFWVFSSNACGVYGMKETRILHAGRTEPSDEIVLAADRDQVHVRAGSGMLLRVNG
jgi:hypothetical protein